MICNSKWSKIARNLEYKQKYKHRPDLVCRVFHSKLLELIDEIVNEQIFGVVLNMYSIEFQKRELTHAHILVTLRPEDKLNTEQLVGAAVSAVIRTKTLNQGCTCWSRNIVLVILAASIILNGFARTLFYWGTIGFASQITDDLMMFDLEGTPNDNRRIVPHNKYLWGRFFGDGSVLGGDWIELDFSVV
ncbi:hypothetical protein TcasGA2_TC010106 [Tribolium castaneum]|uniref:Helitron helicase-like domain-containing protein n=1 Tax=Tribolium castaneum TaxID=7070 RepID=D6WSJ6_TRICA|nr:hypothetical protein TcasGA2_TC010106 [Tribolium castaneum]